MPLRQIIHEHDFDAQLYTLHHEAPRCDEFIYGITEVLARDPTKGRLIPGTDVWYLSTPNIPDFLALVVYYTFNDHTVWLMWIDTP